MEQEFPPAPLRFRSCKRGFLWFHTGSAPVLRSFFVTSICPVLSPALVDIVLIFAPWAAKGSVGPAAQEHLLAVLAQAQGLVTIHQHKPERKSRNRRDRNTELVKSKITPNVDSIENLLIDLKLQPSQQPLLVRN